MEADRPHPVRELLLVAALFLVYKVGRLAVAGDVGAAYANAAHLWTLERSLGLPNEAALQRIVLDHGWLVRGANLYYALVHFPATAAMLIWTYLRRPALYRWARTSLAALTAAGFAVQVLLPMAPPRLLALTGMVDTGHAVGPSVYSAPDTDTLANQYAAMPSLHVGWAAVVAIVLIAATLGQWRWVWLLHPLLTLAVVVITANHYWLDGAMALALLAPILYATSRLAAGPSEPERVAATRAAWSRKRARPSATPTCARRDHRFYNHRAVDDAARPTVRVPHIPEGCAVVPLKAHAIREGTDE
ncbi:phosphatase PAP2 family protein [Actinomycetes bacterium KLBMP 9797]